MAGGWSGLDDAVAGYVELVTWWTNEAGTQAKEVAGQIASGSYGSDQAVSAWAKGMALWWSGWMGLANEMADAALALSQSPPDAYEVTSEWYDLPDGLGDAALSLTGPLKQSLGAVIPPSRVTIARDVAITPPRFRLEVDAALRPAGLYEGTVTAVGNAGSQQIAVELHVA